MSVAFDAVGPSSSGQTVAAGTGLSWSHTCTGTNRAVIVGIALGASSGTNTWAAVPIAVTFGGVTMSVLGHIEANNQTAGFVALFGLVNPPTGASTVSATWTGSKDAEGGSISFTGVDQGTPFGTAVTGFGATASPSVTVTSATGNMVAAVLCNGAGITSSTQTSRWIDNANTNSAAGNGAGATAAGASSVSIGWSVGADWYGEVAVDIHQSSAAVTGGYLVAEEDGTSHFLLEDSSGSLIEEETPPTQAANVAAPTGALTIAGPTPRFGLLPFVTSVSANSRYFLDQNGQPIFPIVDHQWNMIARYGEWNELGTGTTPAQVFAAYAAHQAANGVNATLFLAIGGNTGGGGGPNTNGNTWDSVSPWVGGAIGSLNSTYWSRVDAAINALADQGITAIVNLISSYATGTGTAFAGLNTTNAATYGTAIANRYKSFPNIVWEFGVDYGGVFENEFQACVNAMRTAGDTHIVTCEYLAETITSVDSANTATGTFGRGTSMAYRDIYSYNAAYLEVEHAWQQTANPGTLPALYFNGYYDAQTSQIDVLMVDDRLWAFTSGSMGFFYGSEATWAWASTAWGDLLADTFPNTWLPAFDTWLSGLTGWQNLIPDISSSWITSARGTKVTALASGGSATPYSSGNTYLTGGKTADGTLGVLYTPTSRTITLATALGTTANWVDPYNFSTTSATGGATSYTTPGLNSQGDNRWLLVLQGSSTVTGSATLATTANLSTSASVTEIASATLATTAGLTTAAVVTTSGTASLATTANLAAAGAITAVGSATLATTASLVTSGLAQQIAAVSLGVTANLATSALDTALASSSLATTANLSTSGSIGGLSSATLATTANLVTSASVLEVASALLGTTANLTTTGLDTSFGSASLATVANLATSGSVAGANSALLLVTANLLASGLDTDIASAILATTANLATSGTRILPASALLAATANLSTSGVIGGAASATLPVTANLTATGAVTDVALALLAVTASLTANGRATTTGAALFQTIANLIAFGTIGVLPTFGYALPGTAASGPTAQQGTAPSGPTATRGSN